MRPQKATPGKHHTHKRAYLPYATLVPVYSPGNRRVPLSYKETELTPSHYSEPVANLLHGHHCQLSRSSKSPYGETGPSHPTRASGPTYKERVTSLTALGDIRLVNSQTMLWDLHVLH